MRSMTGCGRCSLERDGWQITAELKSVNHRFLDISCRLPRNLSFLEDVVRRELSAGMKRGHVEVFLTLTGAAESMTAVRVDEALALRYAEAAKAIGEAAGLDGKLSVADLLRMDGVVQAEENVPDEELLTGLCGDAVKGAVEALNRMRDAEGVNLQADLTAHLDAAAALREKILERAPSVVSDYRDRLTARLAQLPIEPVDPARLAQEVALLADKCAIDEELSRLQSHISQMRSYLAAKGEIGKKMDFLIQEMNREANTIGSKANDAVIAQHVVDLKSEIEKLREQIQNVE